jgi:Predicted pPIWI-associating nuclease
MVWKPPQPLQDLARRLREKRFREVKDEWAAALDEIQSKYPVGHMSVPRMTRKTVRLFEQVGNTFLSDLVSAARRQGPLSDDLRAWLEGEIGRAFPSIDDIWREFGRRAFPGREFEQSLRLQLQDELDDAKRAVVASLDVEADSDKAAVSSAGGVHSDDGGRSVRSAAVDARDQRIVAALKSAAPSAAASYEQAARDLAGERLSWRGPAAELREALHDALDALAPKAVVKSQQGFRPEGQRSQPSMRQQARYILAQRQASEGAEESVANAVEVSEELFARFVRSVHVRGSESVHEAAGKTEVVRLGDFVRLALEELLGVIAGTEEVVAAGHQTAAVSGTQEADADSSPHESS